MTKVTANDFLEVLKLMRLSYFDEQNAVTLHVFWDALKPN